MDEQIYIMYIDSEKSVNVYIDDERYDFFYENNFNGNSMIDGWEPPPFIIEDEKLPLKDFVSGTLFAPLISQKAKDSLYPLIKDYVEFLPCMKIKGTHYYILNVIKIVDCVDLENSNISYSSGQPQRILNIMQFEIDNEKTEDVPIFKVPQDTGVIFVTKSFIDEIVKFKLTGIGVENPSTLACGRNGPRCSRL